MRTKRQDRRHEGRGAPVEVALRGLAVLEALNRRPVNAVEQIALHTGLPKSTVVRLLGQLVSAGFAHRLPRRRGYTLGQRVLRLSSGYGSADAVVHIAGPILSAFTSTHKWPVALATLEADAMRIRVSTGPASPFAINDDRSRIGRRVPMLASALGRAYLAFCPADERDIIISLLQASGRKADAPAHEAAHLLRLLASMRRAGYAVSAPTPNDTAIGIAIPVIYGRQVLACISLRYLDRAIAEVDVVARYLAPLRAAAEAISKGTAGHP